MKLFQNICLISALVVSMGMVSTTHAQVTVRPEVAKSLQAAQEALKAGQAEAALKLAQQTLALPGITAVEKPFIQRTLAVSAYQAKNFELAASTWEN